MRRTRTRQPFCPTILRRRALALPARHVAGDRESRSSVRDPAIIVALQLAEVHEGSSLGTHGLHVRVSAALHHARFERILLRFHAAGEETGQKHLKRKEKI